MSTSSTLFQLNALNALKASGKPLAVPTLVLFKNAVALAKTTVMADLMIADFVGYANVPAVVFGNAYLDGANNAIIDAPSADWVASDATVPQLIYGWAIVNAALDTYWFGESFETPVNMNVAGRGVRAQPQLQYGQ